MANLLNKGKNSMLIRWSPLLEWEMERGNKVSAPASEHETVLRTDRCFLFQADTVLSEVSV